MPADDGLRLHQDQVGAPVSPESPQENPEDSILGSKPGLLGAPPQYRELLAEGQILQRQLGPATEEAAKSEGNRPHKEHPYLRLELVGLLQIGLREYAGQVPETQSRQGG